jgi:hypothetical protein
MSTEPMYATVGPSLCVVAKGAKAVLLGREVFEYDPARMLGSAPTKDIARLREEGLAPTV